MYFLFIKDIQHKKLTMATGNAAIEKYSYNINGKENNNRLFQCKFCIYDHVSVAASLSCLVKSSRIQVRIVYLHHGWEFSSQNKLQLWIHPVFHFLMQILTVASCFANCTLLHLFDLLSDLSQIIQLHCFSNPPLQRD